MPAAVRTRGRSCRAIGSRSRDAVGDPGRVRPDAADEVRRAPALELEAEDVEAEYRRDAVAVHDLPVLAEHREVEPRVLAPVAGRPDQRRDPALRRVERVGAGGDLNRGWPVGWVRPAAFVGSVYVLVDPVEQAEQAPLGVVDRRVEVVSEDGASGVEGLEPAGDGDAELVQDGEVETFAAVPAEAEARRALGGGGVGLVDRPLEVAELVQPVPDVAAAVAARDRAWRPTASTTGRPARRSSAAICSPLGPAPTTRTPPSGRAAGLR